MTPQDREEEQSEQSFIVSDKRLFTKEGQRREGEGQTEAAPASPPPPPPPPRQEAPPQAPPRAQAAGGTAAQQEMPPVDFSTFVAMLANNIMMFLGRIPEPGSQQRRLDPVQAKHTIDVLMMLREKTRGNLSTDEERLLEEVLPQLQMAYVSVNRQAG
ncbi:MAG: DUF1844 domain-containing protein [Candidatus Tectomicrobia bacterium]